MENVYLLLSLSYKLFFSLFFLSLTFGLMGCKKGILVFTLLKPIQSSLGTFSFYNKIMDCSTGKTEEKLENSYIIAFPAKIIPGNAMAGKHDRTLLSFKTADLNKG